MDTTYPPYEYVGSDGSTILGLGADLAKAIGKQLNLKFNLQTVPFTSIIPGLTDGKYQMSISAFIDTAARQKKVNFVTYSQGASALYVKTGSSNSYSGLSSLCGVKVGVDNGTAQQSRLQAQSKQCTASGKKPINIVTAGDQNSVNLLVSTGRVDVGMADTVLISYIIKTTHGQFKKVGPPIKDKSQTGVALAKGSGMEKPVKAAIKNLMKNGTYKSILAKWGAQATAISQPQINVAP